MLHIHLCHLCQLIVYTSPIYGLGCQHEQSGIRSCNKAPITLIFVYERQLLVIGVLGAGQERGAANTNSLWYTQLQSRPHHFVL